MINKSVLLAMISICAIALSGCYPTGDSRINQDNIPDYVQKTNDVSESTVSESSIDSIESDNSEASIDNIESDNKINTKFDNVSVNLTLPDVNIESGKNISAKMKEWNAEDVKNLFFKDKGELSYREGKSNMFDDANCYTYNLTDDEYLYIEPGRMRYTTSSNKEYEYRFIESLIFNRDMSSLFQSKEFSDFSINDAKEKVQTYLDKLEINNLGDPIIYSITAEDANKCFDSYSIIEDKDGNPRKQWTDAQQCYYLVYPINYNGTSFSTNREQYVLVAITKDELIEFTCSGIIDSSSVKEESCDIKYDARQALNMVIDYYQKLSLPGDGACNADIIDCKLTYVLSDFSRSLIKNYKPIWEISAKIKDKDAGTVIMQKYVDPQNGDIS